MDFSCGKHRIFSMIAFQSKISVQDLVISKFIQIESDRYLPGTILKLTNILKLVSLYWAVYWN